jgi:hypothetical protein
MAVAEIAGALLFAYSLIRGLRVAITVLQG